MEPARTTKNVILSDSIKKQAHTGACFFYAFCRSRKARSISRFASRSARSWRLS